jgi:hypothetical protein
MGKNGVFFTGDGADPKLLMCLANQGITVAWILIHHWGHLRDSGFRQPGFPVFTLNTLKNMV